MLESTENFNNYFQEIELLRKSLQETTLKLQKGKEQNISVVEIENSLILLKKDIANLNLQIENILQAEIDIFIERPKTVLVAERDPDTSALLDTILEREGYKVSLVDDAYALINMTNEVEPFGVIILDTLIPYIEINSLIQQIRSSKWCDVPILIISSEKNSSNLINNLNNGANDFIEKPFNPRELIARVKRINSIPPGYCLLKRG